MVPTRMLVTGGAGFIGSTFLNRVVRDRPDVAFLNIDALTYAADLDRLVVTQEPHYAFERVDIANSAAVDDVLERFEPDCTVHFAAESHVDRSISDPSRFIRANVVGTHNLLDGHRRLCPTAHFHHIGTDEVYGSAPDGCAFSEGDPYLPSNPYSASKAASDHLVRSWHTTFGTPVTLTLCTNNFGPGQHAEKLIPTLIRHALRGEPMPIYGTGEHRRNWLSATDHCRAIEAVIEGGKVGATYHVSSDDTLSNLQVFSLVCSILADETGTALDALLALRTHVADRPGHDLRYALDSSKIRAELGWRPIQGFEMGLRDTIRWHLESQ